jgi:hypothetical protein
VAPLWETVLAALQLRAHNQLVRVVVQDGALTLLTTIALLWAVVGKECKHPVLTVVFVILIAQKILTVMVL